MNNWIKIAIVAAVVGVVFGLLWKRGQIQRLSAYVRETREELKKCSWPNVDELKASTALIMVMIALLSATIVGIDLVLRSCSFNPFALALVAAAGYMVTNYILLKRQ